MAVCEQPPLREGLALPAPLCTHARVRAHATSTPPLTGRTPLECSARTARSLHRPPTTPRRLLRGWRETTRTAHRPPGRLSHLAACSVGEQVKKKRTTWMPFLESVSIFAPPSTTTDYERGLLADAPHAASGTASAAADFCSAA